MLKNKVRKTLVSKIVLAFFTFCYVWALPATAQTQLVDALNTKLIEIENPAPHETFARFEEFGNVLTNNKILALGEATHGTKEFADFRGTLIKYLVTKLNYKVIVLEADFSGALALNDYIVYGKGNPSECLYKLGVWIWNNQEFLDVVEWLKKYNLSQPLSNKIKIYGCDMQLPEISKDLIDGNIKLKKQLSADAKNGLQVVRNWHGETKKEDLNILQKLALELNEEILLYPDTSTLRHSIKTIIQHVNLRGGDNWYKRSKIRDEIMAENMEWIYDHELKSKTIFMAHNIHIAKNPANNDIKRIGYYLKEKHKDGYYALGFSFFNGDFLAMDEDTGKLTVFTLPEIQNKESSEFIFSQCKTPNFILDFKQGLGNTDIQSFLSKKIYSKNIGASYSLKKIKSKKDITPAYAPLSDQFDGFTFFRKTAAISYLFSEQKEKVVL